MRADSELVVMAAAGARRVPTHCDCVTTTRNIEGPAAGRERLTFNPRNVVADWPSEGDVTL